VTPGLREWRSQLSLGEAERFEATGGDLLEELGYERSVAPGQRTLREAEHVREAFANVMRLRARELPQRW